MSPKSSRTIPAVAEWLESFDGRVVVPGDDRYDDARSLFYGGFGQRPAAIVRVLSAQEVARVVASAVPSGLEIAVRSGGHSPAGHSLSDGGVVIDLSRLNSLDIDPQAESARVGAGLTTGEYTAAAAEHGLATGFGDTGSVGIGGITTAGGVGFLARKHGLTIDSLLGAEVVTADGAVLDVDATSHPDLFWAIQGGGGNFGVVTRLHFRLHQVPSVVGGMLILPARPDVVTGFVQAAEDAPEELSTIANVMVAPPMPMIPEQFHGSKIVFAMLVHSGSESKGMEAVKPFRDLAEPLLDTLAPMAYPDIFMGEQPGYHPAVALDTMFVDEFEPSWSDTILEHLERSTADMAATQLRVLGGAVARVAVDATAYPHRQRAMMINLAAAAMPPADMEPHREWVSGLAGQIRRDDAAYVGFLDRVDADRVRRAYPPSTWDRLTAVKSKYDPHNVFHLNQNIPPAG